jgi:hypothetical protein
MGMGGGLGGMMMTPELQEKMRNSPNYRDPSLYGTDDRPIGSQPLDLGMGLRKFDSTNTTTTADIMGGDRRDPNSQQSNPFQMLGMMQSQLQGTPAGAGATQQTAQQSAAYPNPNTGAGSFSGASLYGGGASQSSTGFGGGSNGALPLEGKYGIVKMANGGLAGAAQNMADKGRNGDSMLVHMTPGEVKGLQQLAMANGGSLSINPDTGLVEANILKRFLPMIAGAALSPFLTPMGAAAVVGGFEGMRTGDIGKGLMAGLGAYGGAGLTGSLSQAGSSSLATPEAVAGQLGVEGASTAANSQAAMLAQQNAGFGTQGLESIRSAAATATPTSIPQFDGSTLIGSQSMGAQAPLPTYGQQLQAGVGQLGTEQGRSAIYNAMPTGTVAGLGATAVSALTPEMDTSVPGVPGLDEKYKRPPYSYELSPDFRGYTPERPRPYYRPRGLGYAEGGVTFDDDPGMDMAAGGIAGYAAGGKMSLGDGIYKDTDTDTASLGAYDAAMKRMEKQHAAANLKPKGMPKGNIAKLGQMKAMAEGGLGGYSDGGRMLKGPGDGMSDDIPAMIGKKQPARLADGEFVVPADVVSHLGNGSTDAGAKRLYGMMDKIRKARTGKKKQAPAVKADKYLPV